MLPLVMAPVSPSHLYSAYPAAGTAVNVAVCSPAAENATDSVEALEGEITIAEDTTFMVSPFLEKGELKVVLKDKATGEQVFEQVVDGKILDYYDVAPGDYALEVSAPSGATTGTCVIFAIENDLLEAQDAGLEEALEINGVDPSVVQK